MNKEKKPLQMSIYADSVAVDMAEGQNVLLEGFTIEDIILELGSEEILKCMDYEDVKQFVDETDLEKEEERAEYRSSVGL